jgi:signal transduction histidine kinase/ligand-binding sensor domain-containing protein
VVLLGLALQAGAFTAGFDPTRYAIDSWRDEDGLPQNSVNALLQSAEGFLFVGTFDGLVRFDGVRFAEVDLGASFDPRRRRVLSMAEDRSGGLLVGTEGAGLVRIPPGRSAPPAAVAGVEKEAVLSLAIDRSECVWIGTERGLFRLPAGTMLAHRFELPVGGDPVTALLPAKTGRIWVGTKHGLFRIDSGRAEWVEAAGRAQVNALAEDREGRLFVGLESHLRILEAREIRICDSRNGFGDGPVWSIVDDPEGGIWISAASGVWLWRDGRFARLPPKGQLTDSESRRLMLDREGSLWIGTRSVGLARVREPLVRSWGREEGLSDEVVQTVLERADGALWVGTNCGGLDRRNPGGRFEKVELGPGLRAPCVWSLLEDRRGDLWIGTWGAGLARLRKGRVERFGAAEGLPSDVVFALVEDGDGELWVGTRSGVARFRQVAGQAGGAFELFGPSSGLPADEVRCLLPGPGRELWIGTSGGGLARIADTRRPRIETIDAVRARQIRSLHRDGDGRLWIGTFGDGLWMLGADGRSATIRRADGLIDDVISTILQDEAGNFWMSSNRGIGWVSKAAIDAFLRGETSSIPSALFGRSDGMKSRECNGGSQPAGARGKDGHLWFPTIGGLVEIDPGRARLFETAPPVVIEELFAEGKEFPRGPEGEVVFLPAGTRRVEFHWTGLTLLGPQRLRFQYRLDGIDPGWIDAGSRRSTWYTNLFPGEYVFRVRASDFEGNFDGEGRSLRLRVDRRFRETRLFAGIVVLLLAGLAFGAHRLRVRYLEARRRELEERVAARTRALEQEIVERRRLQAEIEEAREEALAATRSKSELIARMSHELRTPLTSILGFSAVLADHLDSPAVERNRKFLGYIETSGRHLLELINDLLDLARAEAGRLDIEVEAFDPAEAVASAVELVAGFALSRRVEILVESPPEGLPPMEADPVRMKQVLVNLIANAVRFSPEGERVVVRVRPADLGKAPGGRAALRIDVVDRGPGISTRDRERIFEEFRQADFAAVGRGDRGGSGLGLTLARRFVELHGGRLEVETAVGVGSTFTAIWPLSPSREERGRETPTP